MNEHIRVKWIAGNMPVIVVRRNDARLYITKRELVAIKEEIESFVEYYKDDFTEERIDDSPDDNWEWNDLRE